MSFLRRQLVTAALTANALQPLPGYWTGIPTMFGGWLTGELAPHLLALTAADTVREVARGKRNPRALSLAAGSLVGLVAVIAESDRAKAHVDRALVESLGADYRDRLSAQHTDLDLSTPLRQLAMPFRMHDDEVEITKDVAYADHGRRGLLDVYRKRDGDIGNAPVLLQVHGGGWTIGNKDQQGIPLMLHMAARGWVCVAINYRLSPRDAFPAHLVDVKRAVAWIREHGPSYGADPAFVAITGGSAGGHLTALAALTPERPGVPARLRGRRHHAAGSGAALRRLRLRRCHRGQEGAADARRLPRPASALQGPPHRARGVREGLTPAARQ